MDEIFKYQETITESLRLENEKFSKLPSLDQANEYYERLVHLKRSMQNIEIKAAKLRRQANKLIEERQKSRERQELLDKALEPVVNTNKTQ